MLDVQKMNIKFCFVKHTYTNIRFVVCGEVSTPSAVSKNVKRE